MAAAFKIHIDDDTVSQFQENKRKEIKTIGTRCALGQIQNNQVSQSFKNLPHHASKRDAISKDADLPTGFTKNIKALALKENNKKKQEIHKINSVRSPLKDLQNNRRITDVKNTNKVPSPMSIDTSPLVKNDCKENFQPLASKKTVQTPAKPEEKCVEEKDDLTLASPMSIEASPARTPKNDTFQSDLEDLYGCLAYKADIYKYLRKLEEDFRPKAYYMRRQPDVSYSMRTILVDWLVEVSEEYKLNNETLFMAVSYVDRFLSTMAVTKPKLQLLGTSAMFIAAKFEEIYPPEVGEFTYITDDSYTAKQVLRMERLILKVLSFDLSCPTAYTFIMHISSCIKLPGIIIFLAMYICELTLLEADPYLDFYPSMIASGAIALSRRCLDYADVWPSCLAQATGYTFLQLGPVVNHLNETHQKSFTLPQTAIRQKYCAPEYECVSKIPFKRLVVRESIHN